MVQAPIPLKSTYDAITTGRRTLLLLLPVALLGAGLGGRWLTDRSLRSVRRIAQTAERIGAEDLSRRLDQSGGDEFARLAATFNRMLERLERAFTAERRLLENHRRFTADASHELKTPLAVIKANTSLVLSGPSEKEDCLAALCEIDSAVDSMSRMVHDLLLLARSDAGQLGRERVEAPIRELLGRAISRVSRREGAPIRLSPGGEMICIQANEDEMIRLFANLLENALRHTPPDGEITVDVVQDSDEAIVTVTDTGSGIAPEHLPHLGERFYRVDSGRARREGGTGLGLSICLSIAEAHGGRLSIASSPGAGTTVSVFLPASLLPLFDSERDLAPSV